MQSIYLILSFSLCLACTSKNSKTVATTVKKLEANLQAAPFVNEYSKELDRLYRLDSIVTLKGKLKRDKSGIHLNGVYLETAPNTKKPVVIQGRLKRVASPLAYYSTDASPQGMFSDTSIKHYRLFIEPSNIQILSD